MSGLFIPKKLRVGFQKREDTFTGQLAYVIYYDEKGQLRKEKSHNSWCDKELGFLELDNGPRSGFVLNKGVERNGYWGSGRSVIRVHDERGFEIEITVDNLMGLLMHSDVSKRDIVEQCVYAWSGTELVLLPCNSQEYLAAQEFTLAQLVQLSAKDLRVGFPYRSKKDTGTRDYGSLVYLGHMEWEGPEKKHVFWDKGYEKASAVGVSALREDGTEEDVGYAQYLSRALGAQKKEVQALTPKLMVVGGEYEEVVRGYGSRQVRKWVYLGQFPWASESSRHYGQMVDVGSDFKKRCVFLNVESGEFDSVQCRDLVLNLKPNVVQGWVQVVALLKKTRFTSMPTGRQLQSIELEDVISSGFFWTVVAEDQNQYKTGRLHAIKRVEDEWEVSEIGAMTISEGAVRDSGLWGRHLGTTRRMKTEEVSEMQPMGLILMQENGVEIKWEDYNVLVKRGVSGDFEMVHEWEAGS